MWSAVSWQNGAKVMKKYYYLVGLKYKINKENEDKINLNK